MPKSIPISVRLSDEDVAFLAQYEVQGARTPSDKLREILKAARAREEGVQDVAACEDLLRSMARPAEKRVRQLQRGSGRRSDFVMKLYERIPEIFAELISSAPEAGAEEGKDLHAFEAELSAEVFSLIEEVFDLGLTSPNRTYDPALMDRGLRPILEISEILQRKRRSEAE